MNIDSWRCMAWDIKKLHQSEFTEGCSIAAYYRNLLGNKLLFREDVHLSNRGECDYETCHLTQVTSYLNKSIRGAIGWPNSSHPT